MKHIVLLLGFLLVSGFPVFADNSGRSLSDAEIKAEFARMRNDFTASGDDWVFTRVVGAEGRTKADIYLKAVEVLAEIYHDSNEVIQNKDKEAGVIIGKGFVESPIRKLNWATLGRNRCWHLIKIDIRDNRYKITLTVSSVWWEIGADLRGPFNGTEHKFSEFYPLWTSCKPKLRQTSFGNLRFVHESSLETLDLIASKIDRKLTEEDDW